MLDVMFYSYCKAFTVNPAEAKNTPISLIKKMLEIETVVKQLEAEELKKQTK